MSSPPLHSPDILSKHSAHSTELLRPNMTECIVPEKSRISETDLTSPIIETSQMSKLSEDSDSIVPSESDLSGYHCDSSAGTDTSFGNMGHLDTLDTLNDDVPLLPHLFPLPPSPPLIPTAMVQHRHFSHRTSHRNEFLLTPDTQASWNGTSQSATETPNESIMANASSSSFANTNTDVSALTQIPSPLRFPNFVPLSSISYEQLQMPLSSGSPNIPVHYHERRESVSCKQSHQSLKGLGISGANMLGLTDIQLDPLPGSPRDLSQGESSSITEEQSPWWYHGQRTFHLAPLSRKDMNVYKSPAVHHQSALKNASYADFSDRPLLPPKWASPHPVSHEKEKSDISTMAYHLATNLELDKPANKPSMPASPGNAIDRFSTVIPETTKKHTVTFNSSTDSLTRDMKPVDTALARRLRRYTEARESGLVSDEEFRLLISGALSEPIKDPDMGHVTATACSLKFYEKQTGSPEAMRKPRKLSWYRKLITRFHGPAQNPHQAKGFYKTETLDENDTARPLSRLLAEEEAELVSQYPNRAASSRDPFALIPDSENTTTLESLKRDIIDLERQMRDFETTSCELQDLVIASWQKQGGPRASLSDKIKDAKIVPKKQTQETKMKSGIKRKIRRVYSLKRRGPEDTSSGKTAAAKAVAKTTAWPVETTMGKTDDKFLSDLLSIRERWLFVQGKLEQRSGFVRARMRAEEIHDQVASQYS